MTKHVHDPGELQQACNAAEPGDVILIHGGFYALPARLSHKRGARERPIVIRAADEKWISCAQSPNPYWGGGDPTTSAPTKPGIDDFAFLIFDECAWIVVEGLHIKNCWPSIFYLKDSNHVAIRGCTLRHGTYAVFAKGIPRPTC